MLINLNKLNESLEAKYKLNESESLNERFDNMPKWLSDRIVTTKVSDLGAISGDMHKIGKNNPNQGPRPTYTSRGYAYSSDRFNMSLFKSMLDHGINLDSVEVIEGEVPTKNTDPRTKEPNIPIYLFDNGQVYAKGINDQEEYRDFVDKDGYNNPRAFKYLPFKYLKEKATKFAYIDGSKDSNFAAADKRTKRNIVNQEVSQIPNYNRRKDMAGQKAGRWSNEYFDKSGYLVVPTVQKYKKELSRLKADKIYDIMQEHYNYLVEVKEELANFYSNIDIDDMLDSNDLDSFDELRRYLMDAIGYYKRVVSRIDNITSDSSYTDEDKKNRLAGILEDDWDYGRLMNSIQRLKDSSKDVFNSIIDWI